MHLSALLLTALLTLAGCGQKGPLVLPPDEPAQEPPSQENPSQGSKG